jgi:deoxynucleoside triphosphate triphosphohydrolase SAMHD1
VPFDYNRLLLNSKVIDNVICYNKKIVHTVYSVFQDRFSLFQQVYSHKVGQAIGLMIRDAVLNAESVLNLRNVYFKTLRSTGSLQMIYYIG